MDEIERNDESFILTAETNAKKILRIRLYPTLIRDFQARLATGNLAAGIAYKMQNLCAELGTLARWLPKRRCLEIALPEYPPAHTVAIYK